MRTSLPTSRSLLRQVTTVTGLLMGAGAVAQNSDAPPLVERVDVQLVVVDAYVTNEAGEPVLGLGRDDFAVLEDGSPVEIRQFTGPDAAVGGDASETPTAVHASEASAERLVVFIDELHLHPHHRVRVLQQLRQALKKDKGDAQIMLARFDGQLRVELPFTRDRSAVLDVLDRELDVRRIPMLNAFTEVEQTLRYLESLQAQNVEGGDFGDACTQNGHIARKHAQQAHTLALQSIAGMMRMVGSLSGASGRKSLLHVSDGIPMMPGTRVYGFAAEMCDGTGAIEGLENAVDTQLFGSGKNTRWNPKLAAMELAEFELTRPWRQLGALANTHQVSVYPLQATGITVASRTQADGTRTSMRTELDARNSVREALQLIADDTGGRALFDTNDFRSVITGVLEEGDGFYQLAYEPPNPGDGQQHRIEVRTPGVDAKIRHRSSYISQSYDQQLADVVIAALVHGGEDNPLSARLSVDPGERQSTQQRATLKIAVPLGSLARVPRDGEEQGEFTVAVGIMDKGDRIQPIGSKTIRVVIPPEPTEQNYVYDVEIELDRKGGMAAIAIRDDVEGRVSFFRREIAVAGS